MDEALGVVCHVIQPVPDCWVVRLDVLLSEPLLKDVRVDIREHHGAGLSRHLRKVLPGAEDHLRQLHLWEEEEDDVSERVM